MQQPTQYVVHRWSQLFIPTLREAPADAEVASHKLLLRGGYIRQLGAGIYSYLPLGQRAINKIVAIVREEMDTIGQEFLLPTIHPKELWEASGRWSIMGDNMFRLKDRKGAELCLGMTHEEVMTDIARSELRSYKQLPQIWYQVQTKFRDEPRPKSGLLRVRQFIMKDAYSFDIDEAGLDASYDKHNRVYRNIFDRCGLEYVAVEADSGAMGGSQSQEFMVYTEAGEDLIASCPNCHYAANLEKATSQLMTVEELPGEGLPELIHTPGQRTIDEVGAFLNSDLSSPLCHSRRESAVALQSHHQIKTMAYMVRYLKNDDFGQDTTPVEIPTAVFLRGDHSVNEAKLLALMKISGAEIKPMNAEEVAYYFGAPSGSLGPMNLDRVLDTDTWNTAMEKGFQPHRSKDFWASAPLRKRIKTFLVLDKSLEGRSNLIAGANKAEYHLLRVTPTRDFKPTLIADIRSINEGEGCPVCGTPLKLGKAVEIGHIFKLGRRYTTSMNATVLNKDGKEVTPTMGSYGIGIERILTAAIETSAAKFARQPDAKVNTDSYALPPAIAPFEVVVTITNVKEPDLLAAGEMIAANLAAAGFDVLLDDRDERAGVKFKDSEMIGIPYRINVGKKIAEGKIELVDRLTGRTHDIAVVDVTERLETLLLHAENPE